MRVRCTDGEDGLLVIHVPPGDGTVCASLGKTSISLPAADVSRLVDLYRLAQVVAITDRGTW